MSKKLKRSAVALVLAATMVFSSQGVLTAFAAGGDIETGAPVSSALERSPDEGKTDVADESGNTDETETPEVTEPCDKTEGCTLSKDHEGECQVTPVDPPVEDENGEDETQPCTKTEGCTLENGHEGECVVEENTEDTEDTQEPSEEDVAAVQAVVDVINSLPTTDDLANYTPTIELKPEDEGYQEAYQAALDAYYSQVQEQVKAARSAYDALTEEQKAAFDATVLAKLTALEELIAMREQADVLPTGNPETAVAKIREDNYYDTLDEAIEAATDGDTIKLLGNATVSKTLDKSITIDGQGFTMSSTNVRYGFSTGTNLTLKNITANFIYDKEVENPSYSSDLGLFYVNGDTNFTFENATINMNGSGATNRLHAIYYDSCAGTISVKKSNLNISKFPEDAIEWGGKENSNLIIENSTYSSIHNRQGITGTWDVTIENSTVQVLQSTASGSNGANFNITNSIVDFSSSASHGLSAGNLTIQNSEVTTNNNGYCGIVVGGKLDISNNSEVTVEGNAFKNDGVGANYAGLRLSSGESTTISTIDASSSLSVNNNKNTGVYVRSGNLTIADGADIEIMNNTVTNEIMDGFGGGIYVGYQDLSTSEVILPADAKIYNNHSKNGGDDIYVAQGTSLTFGKVGSDWILDDTNLPITNWFYDGKKDGEDTNRWSVGNYYEVFTPGAITGLQAIKAAHQYSYNPDTPTIPDGDFEWETSKSKHAEELEKQADGTYTSNVTLSLPAADFEPEIDVVFVIDDTHAGSGIFAGSVKKLLNELRAKDNLDVNIGVVTFDAIARDWLQVTSNGELSGLVSLNENYDAILKAINTELTEGGEGTLKKLGGSNTEWPLAMANEMLSRGNGSEQHVVMFSDMFGYVYRGDLIVGDTTYHDVPLSKKLGNSDKGQLCISSPKYDTWEDVKNHIDEDEPQYDTFFRDPQWASYWTNYGVGEVPDIDLAPKASVPQYGEGLVPYSYITPFEKSCYLTYSEAIELMNNGVHLTFINNDFNPGDNGETIQTIRTGMLQDLASNGATFIQKETANGATLDENQMEEVFTALENKLLYVVDAGSQVIDVIGEGKDNKGNDYNFDFVDVVSLIVGGEEYEIHHEEGSDIYYFGTSNEDGVYPFVLTYYPDGFGVSAMNNEDNEDSIQEIIAGELFIWDINVPITVDEPVQLTYTVKLTNPQTAYGTYGEYDANGENGSTSLYTNNSAILYPVDSTGARREEEAFLKPTVSYTVDNDNDNPGTDPTPDPDPDPDRPSRPNRDDDDDWEPLPDAPVKDKPTTEVDVPEETETPTTEQPDKYNPETGDTTTVFAAMALAAVSLGGVVLLGRKKK